MAKAAKKITLSRSRDIPFNKLVLSEANVRRTEANLAIEELAQDIDRREDLVQGLNVRPVLDADGNETGMFEIPAGGRRYRALERLVKAKRFPKDGLVPCIVRDPTTKILAEDDSLAENTQRLPLLPLDQYRAFMRLRDKGMTEEEIASAFFTTVQVVKQRLRLVSVSQVLLDVYAADGMTLEMLMAFTVNPDHARQEQIWEAIQHSYNRQPWHIRQLLTETTIPASDKRALFVGVEAYKQAGGTVLRDLFEADEGGWLQDPALLDRLVSEKLKATADEIANEGWKWLTVDVDLPYGYDHGLRALTGSFVDLTKEERAAREALREEHERLEVEYAGTDELPDEIDQRLGAIEAELQAFEKRPVIYDPVEIARAGAFVSIDRDGELVIDRGHVRPEDEAPETIEGDKIESDADAGGDPEGTQAVPSVQRAVITIGGQPTEPEDDEEDVIKPLPERLVAELTAHRTLALRDAVGGNPQVALTALLHKLVRDTFQRAGTSGASLQASVNHVFFREQGKDLAESPYAKSIAQRHEDWEADLPGDDDALWDWLDALDDASRLALLAHCVSYGVNALYERPNPFSGSGVSQHSPDRRMAEADRLARATGLDMIEAGFRPTVDNYLSRVTKLRILTAVREGAGERAASLIEHLKKGDMAKEAERLLADTGWLPEPLRMIDLGQDAEPAVEAGVEALPAFLTDEEDEDHQADDDERQQLVAAE
ncbi:ParB/RepB/Spo0J family partition protein [Mesorhizobium retamae]|uniref:ParB/RepB/Spo0J family partition protein n=1 Tax=Mesorhizobium retamae TaxID=2912854 RepID=A0ABS9QEJ1_9HYPH|nr:ParB/RepB/Spo0J family partition protein [Mesorhizobium sp. IRAMC:0171]MCG7505837.1 ParB/RepB/Spo0J family partition protein [Mesorhizobium sp. IRAMC:0171]